MDYLEAGLYNCQQDSILTTVFVVAEKTGTE
jgi:hypothetical protein